MNARMIRRLSLIVALYVTVSTAYATADDHYFQVIYDATKPVSAAYQTDLGYAVFISFDGARILMDTGDKPDILANNLKVAGVDVAGLDLVAISHDHPDHAGGLSHIRGNAPTVPLYAPPGQELDGGEIQRIADHLEVTPNLFLIRSHTDQPMGGIADELSVLIKTAEGPYLITACSHTGLARIVDKATEIAGEDIFFYTGGAGLASRPKQDSVEVAGQLKARQVRHVSPGHCSVSHEVSEVFKTRFDTGYASSHLGMKMPLIPPRPAQQEVINLDSR